MSKPIKFIEVCGWTGICEIENCCNLKELKCPKCLRGVCGTHNLEKCPVCNLKLIDDSGYDTLFHTDQNYEGPTCY